jgi:hypothetical protein
MKSFIKDGQIKGDEKVGEYNTYGVDEKFIKKIFLIGKCILMRQLCLQWREWADIICLFMYLWFSDDVPSTTRYMISYDRTIPVQTEYIKT